MAKPRLVLVWLMAGAVPALGQNALGDGRGLERRLELSAPSTRIDRSMAWNREFEFRDAIVTGNAPNGLSFRGDTAFSNEREFRGELGSNDLFAFRRDSLYSGLSGQGIRGTESLQFQFALTSGGRAPSGLLGMPMEYGSGSGAMSQDLERFRNAGGDRPNWARSDPYGGTGGLMGSLRAPSAYLVNRTFQPAVMSTSRDLANAPIGVTASGLGGLRSVPLAERGLELPPGAIGAGPTLSGALRTSYDLVNERLAEFGTEAPVATGEPTVPLWEQRLNDLKTQLADLQAGPANPFARFSEADLDPVNPTDESQDEPPGYEGLAPETIEMIRRVGQPMERFVTGPAEVRDLYAEHMRIGQELLARGSYFDAEERFTRALSARSDDPAATTGRVHAQIGAGLYRSASSGLRGLLLAKPEMSAMRYGAETLPGPARLPAILAELRENAGLIETARPPTLMRESALLLAYLAFQTGDNQTCSAALEALSEAGGERALVELLRGVWLEKEEQVGG